MPFLARVYVCAHVGAFMFCLRQFFRFSESGRHADYEVIDLEEEAEEELRRGWPD